MRKPRILVDLIVAKLAEDAEKARVRAQKASDVLLQELDTEIAPTPYEILSKYQKEFVPKIAQWLKDRDEGRQIFATGRSASKKTAVKRGRKKTVSPYWSGSENFFTSF